MLMRSTCDWDCFVVSERNKKRLEELQAKALLA